MPIPLAELLFATNPHESQHNQGGFVHSNNRRVNIQLFSLLDLLKQHTCMFLVAFRPHSGQTKYSVLRLANLGQRTPIAAPVAHRFTHGPRGREQRKQRQRTQQLGLIAP